MPEFTTASLIGCSWPLALPLKVTEERWCGHEPTHEEEPCEHIAIAILEADGCVVFSKDTGKGEGRDTRIVREHFHQVAAMCNLHRELVVAVRHVEQHCPCGARADSLRTHPHVAGCPVGLVLEKLPKKGKTT